MKIVFYRYGNICETDILESFNRMGIEAIEESTEINQKDINGDHRIEKLARLILNNKPIFVFSINFFPFISEICERLKVLYLCWSVDCPVLEIYSTSIRNKMNRIFLFDYKQYSSVVDENPECIFYLPLATNTSRWNRILEFNSSERKYSYDVSFVGSLYNEYSKYPLFKMDTYDQGFFDGMLSSQLEIEGLDIIERMMTADKANRLLDALRNADELAARKYDIETALVERDKYVAINYILGMELTAIERMNIINGLSSLFEVHLFTGSSCSELKNTIVHGKVSTHTEMPRVFSESKINLNITMRGIQTGISQRVWDIMGCGGFVLTDYQVEIPKYFTIGKDLVCYENPVECAELVSYYLEHEDERKEIAHSGNKKVKKSHSYDIRLAQLIKFALQV